MEFAGAMGGIAGNVGWPEGREVEEASLSSPEMRQGTFFLWRATSFTHWQARSGSAVAARRPAGVGGWIPFAVALWMRRCSMSLALAM